MFVQGTPAYVLPLPKCLSITQEFALKACIEHFNNTYYNQEGTVAGASGQAQSPSTAQGGAATANPPQASSNDEGEVSQLIPLDCNYLSVLGKQVHNK